MSYLEKIKCPSDLKKLNISETNALASEIRERIIDILSENGGHVASNLGVVELTLALHRVFDLPKDSIIFDVGHQCYVHKLITGRNDRFDTIRQHNGMSGFTNRAESEYDAFGAGHSGTSVSAALGIAKANKLNGVDAYSVAVVGDGSFTNGMIYEALNNCSADSSNVVIVLNDNEMSISKNVGAMSNYLSEFSNTRWYIKFKNRVYAFCLKTKWFGKFFMAIGRFFKNAIKKLFMTKNYFECLGLKYFGPIDGHDQELLELVFEQAKRRNSPCIVHVITKKGKGYKYAEEKADVFHSVGRFNKENGETAKPKYDFSAAFGDALVDLASQDDDIVAVTAAMEKGTGLSRFAREYKERFFDVGIAEEHALTFCAGLAAAGKKPIFAVYSSFLQRSYDQLIHDVAIQKLPVVVCIDRAGLVPGDGKTHQGIYDSSFLLGIPEFTVYTPENYADLKIALKSAIESNRPCAVRYPKGTEAECISSRFEKAGDFSYGDFGSEAKDVAFITYGRITQNVCLAAKLLEDCGIRVIKLHKIKPIDTEMLFEKCSGYKNILIVEEGIQSGGVGERIALDFGKKGLKTHVHAIDPSLGFSGDLNDLYFDFGFTPEKIANKIRNLYA
ncbi:MAG: 1-deoxy-D-xylulose-5-phosphate synthase [Clostridia bacterium]|nr:1-deoxy-D-xylulose-5-phosphate synthase [Clostridia bacterium]